MDRRWPERPLDPPNCFSITLREGRTPILRVTCLNPKPGHYPPLSCRWLNPKTLKADRAAVSSPKIHNLPSFGSQISRAERASRIRNQSRGGRFKEKNSQPGEKEKDNKPKRTMIPREWRSFFTLQTLCTAPGKPSTLFPSERPVECGV